MKNPNNRIKEEVRLPSGRGKELKIAMFAAGEAATKAKDAGIHVITPQEIEELGGKKGKAKKIANSSSSSSTKWLLSRVEISQNLACIFSFAVKSSIKHLNKPDIEILHAKLCRFSKENSRNRS